MPLALRSFAAFPVFLGELADFTGSVRAGSLAGGGRSVGFRAAGLAAAPFPPPPKSGSLKPAADLRSCADNAASLAIEAAVAVDPSAVCEEISRTTCMFFEILPEAAACWRALAEMFCTRLAI